MQYKGNFNFLVMKQETFSLSGAKPPNMGLPQTEKSLLSQVLALLKLLSPAGNLWVDPGGSTDLGSSSFADCLPCFYRVDQTPSEEGFCLGFYQGHSK